MKRALGQEPWLGYATAVFGVGAVSVLIGLVERGTHIANVSMLYLVAVLLTATCFGSGPAVAASIVAFLTFDWFFVEPRYTLSVADPEEWVALLLFLLTAITTGQLAAGQRRRAEEARQREREAVILYDIVRFMADSGPEPGLQAVAERLRQELQLAGVAIQLTDAEGAPTRAVAGDPEALALIPAAAARRRRVLGQGQAPTASQRGGTGRWVRIVPPRAPGGPPSKASDRLYSVPITAQGRRIGALVLVRPPGAPRFSPADDRVLSAAATQLGLGVERARLAREANEAEVLRRTDELKTALLNAVSHDLRTPLATIMASAGSLRQADMTWSEADVREFAREIEQEAVRLNHIVSNLLDLSRIEAGALRPAADWHDLGALVQETLSRLRLLTAAHPLEVSIPADLPPLWVDAVEIDQVISNLVENAVKYTPAGSSISLTARQVGDEVEIEVADRGPGLPPAALSSVFDPFVRVNGSGPRPRGTGLGLAVARGLVQAHGGRIWAENRPAGGARFVFTLPLRPPPATQSPAPVAADVLPSSSPPL